MLILLDCRPLQQEGPDNEKSRFILSCVNILTAEQGVEWLFLVDGAFEADWLPGISGASGKPLAAEGYRLLTKRAFPGKGGWKLWYDWQIPLAIKRYKPDLVMTTGGLTAAARIQVPQCVWMPIRADRMGTVKKTYRGLYLKRLAGSLQRAQVIFTFSGKDKDFLIRQGDGAAIADKILVIPPAADEHPPLPVGEKEKIKESYAEGKEYFFTAVSGVGQGEVVELLKAFSLFKKRQRSNMQFVLAGKDPASDKELAGRLATYKYRQDIHWVGHPSEAEWVRLAGASYAIVFPFDRDSLGTRILNAWKAGVPVITTVVAGLPDGVDAVLYVQPGDPASLAGQLMLIYKDESLRNSLIEQGMKHGQSFSWERSAAIVWEGITGAAKAGTPKISKSAINN
jgi:glycosyltransferase involved in cell wall biosynthesis